LGGIISFHERDGSMSDMTGHDASESQNLHTLTLTEVGLKGRRGGKRNRMPATFSPIDFIEEF